MTFDDYLYTRLDIEKEEKEFLVLLEEFKGAKSFDIAYDLLSKINEKTNDWQTSFQLAHIRNSRNIYNEFYAKEKEFVNDVSPRVTSLKNKYYKALLASKFRKELEKEFGEHLFTLLEYSLKVFSDDVIDLLKEENRLSNEYTKLKTSAKILFDGKENNLSQMSFYLEHEDRSIRKKALIEWMKFFEENEEEFDEIYDKLVHVRDAMAKKLGYENFVQLGYDRMKRSDYTYKDVKVFREEVQRYLVPLATSLYQKQAERIGIEDFKYYDEPFKFKNGNPLPKGNKEWMVQKAEKMYYDLSDETGEFFSLMIEKDLLDLSARKGKVGGGYCTYLSKFKEPFIFSNFNGTSYNAKVLTHEAGHAFQKYLSRAYKVFEYLVPTYELAEVHSIGMEFLTRPFMEEFFEEDADKYRFSHLDRSIKFIPYGTCVDEFQHFVYENPDVTPKERKAEWRRLEEKYFPHRDYDGMDFLLRGGLWFKQMHIFLKPFYYIDYALAQLSAMQLWIQSKEDKKSTWNNYMKLCAIGGSKPFLEAIESANIKNPFKHGTVKEVVEHLTMYVDALDDRI